MLNTVSKTIEKYNMIQKSERVMVGLSGGADSVSLLLCLYRLGYSVSACHINHQLRGNESLRDEQFCVDLCDKLDIPIQVTRIDVKAYCNEHSCSVEEGARELRYQIFSQSDADKIATAHTLSDCLETTVFNLARGTGLKGLCSIPPTRGNIIRPLIECTREDIESFLQSEYQDYVTDSTNLETEYSRNKIRHKIIPILKEINGSLFDTFKGTLNNIKNDEAYLEKQTDVLLEKTRRNNGYRADILKNADTALKNRAIAKILKKNNISCNYQRIIYINEILNSEGKINLQTDTFAICKDNLFYIEKLTENRSPAVFYNKVDFSDDYNFYGRKISFEITEYKNIDSNVHKKFANNCCDYDKIKGVVFLRNRRNGDRIAFPNRNYTSSVKKLFNANIPQEQRDYIAMLSDDEGLIWVEGFGCADRVKIDSDTKHILICKIS